MKFKKNGGFTLVELIVVIAILAILAGVAVPAYSGYIAKANEAADLQLLGSLNTAFGAACLENGVAVNDDLKGAEFTMTGDEGEKTITGLTLPASVTATLSSGSTTPTLSEKVFASFANYYADNMTTPFKVYVQIVFNNGAFEGRTADEAMVTFKTESGVTVTMKKDDADKFAQSVYGTDMESAVLLGKVDQVTGVAAQMMVDKDGNISQLFTSTNYRNAFANALGLEGEALVEKNNELIREKLALMYPDLDLTADGIEDSDEWGEAEAAIIANNAVLFAAQNTPKASEGILDILAQDGTTKTTIAGNLMDESANDVGLAQAAIAYGMYTAYAQRYGKEVPADPVDVLTKLDTDAEFKAYIKGEKIGESSTAGQADQDLAGYLAAMNMINSNTGNSALVEDVLVNGFNTADLQELLNQATGK